MTDYYCKQLTQRSLNIFTVRTTHTSMYVEHANMVSYVQGDKIDERVVDKIGDNKIVSPENEEQRYIESFEQEGPNPGFVSVKGLPNLLRPCRRKGKHGDAIKKSVAINMNGQPSYIFYPYKLHAYNSRLVWVEHEPQGYDTIISERGRYIVDLITEQYIEIDSVERPEMTTSGTFILGNKKISWTNGGFVKTEIEKEDDKTEIDDMTDYKDAQKNKQDENGGDDDKSVEKKRTDVYSQDYSDIDTDVLAQWIVNTMRNLESSPEDVWQFDDAYPNINLIETLNEIDTHSKAEKLSENPTLNGGFSSEDLRRMENAENIDYSSNTTEPTMQEIIDYLISGDYNTLLDAQIAFMDRTAKSDSKPEVEKSKE